MGNSLQLGASLLRRLRLVFALEIRDESLAGFETNVSFKCGEILPGKLEFRNRYLNNINNIDILTTLGPLVFCLKTPLMKALPLLSSVPAIMKSQMPLIGILVAQFSQYPKN
jgi:hypothetical protein